MAAISANHINPFLMASSSVLRDCCMLSDLEIGKPYLRDTSFSADDWVIMIGLTGELKGQVLIAFSTEAVLDVASRMCMTTIQQMDEMSSSAICELGNMILGNAATILAANEIGIDITPPTLSHGMVEFRSSLTKNLCIPMTFDGGKKLININLSIVG